MVDDMYLFTFNFMITPFVYNTTKMRYKTLFKTARMLYHANKNDEHFRNKLRIFRK